jgi:hypothetical protein
MKMQADFVTTLMTNNEKARDQALKLNEEVSRLRKRETELTKRIQELLGSRAEKSEEDRAFLEWLLIFRLESEEPSKKKIMLIEEKKIEIPDERSNPYPSPIHVEPLTEAAKEKIKRMQEELKLLSRLKKKEKFPWLETRRVYQEDEIIEWETTQGVKLPSQFRVLLQTLGANLHLKSQVGKIHIHTYSPLISLAPLDDIGWTEIYGNDDEPERYEDDDKAEAMLDMFGAGHEYDDSFVCDQLCGKNKEPHVRVLLIGAPLEVKMANGCVVNSRMFLNIRPQIGGEYAGDGLLYRLDCFQTSRDESDSELVKVGNVYDWLESSIIEEVEARYKLAGEKDPLVLRYKAIIDRKRPKAEVEECMM